MIHNADRACDITTCILPELLISCLRFYDFAAADDYTVSKIPNFKTEAQVCFAAVPGMRTTVQP